MKTHSVLLSFVIAIASYLGLVSAFDAERPSPGEASYEEVKPVSPQHIVAGSRDDYFVGSYGEPDSRTDDWILRNNLFRSPTVDSANEYWGAHGFGKGDITLGEISRVEIWLNDPGLWTNGNIGSRMWGEAQPGSTVTILTPYDELFILADPACGGCWSIDDVGTILPGDQIVVSAGQGLQPVNIIVPDPFDVSVSASTDEVWGQIDDLDHEMIGIHGAWEGGFQEVQTDSNGFFSGSFTDIPPGGHGHVSFADQIDNAEVVFHRPFWGLELVLDINYAHDWVQGVYEPGHTVLITVTESDAFTVKGTAVLQTYHIPGWEGDSGFSTIWTGWETAAPDIIPGDWILGLVDNGFNNEIQVGNIDFNVDWAADIVAGNLTIPLISVPVPVRCELWRHPENPGIEGMVNPAGGPINCDFSTQGYDVEPPQIVAVMYWEMDGDRVINADAWPNMVANIGPWSGGDRHVWGHWAEPGGVVSLAIENDLGNLIAGTAVQADLKGNFDSADNFPVGSLSPWNVIEADFNNGITDTLTVYPMGGQADISTDIVTVTAAGQSWFTVFLEYCDLDTCFGIDMGEIGGSGIVSKSLAESGWDIQPGQSFHAHLRVWNGHEVIFSWGLPQVMYLPLVFR